MDLLNNYFTSISSLDDNNKELPIMQPRCTVNFPNLVIQEQEVFDIISVIPVNKAVGPDCISHKMLKSCKETISYLYASYSTNHSHSEPFQIAGN